MSARMGALYQEHVYLGATFEPAADGGAPGVASYHAEKDPAEACRDGAVLADLTGSTYLLVSGASAGALASAALAGRELSVGEAAFEAVLTGEGCLLAVPLALRSGDHEVVLADVSGRGASLEAWLGFLASAESDGYAPYAGTAVEDASDMLVPLLLAGASSGAVLSDYVRTPGEGLPARGRVAAVHLDAIPALVARVPARGPEAWLVLVPARSARAIWRSLLSFREVSPVGLGAVRALASRALPWWPALPAEGPEGVGRDRLADWGVLRAGSGFVGARALGE